MMKLETTRQAMNRRAREKKRLVPDSALIITDTDLVAKLDKALFRATLASSSNDYTPKNAQALADRFMTPLRTVISKVYTETRHATDRSGLTDDEVRDISDWFNGQIIKYLQESQELLIKHREEIRNSTKDS